MAEKRKSIIDEALLESAQIEKAFEANAKEILTRTMSSEIEDLVKESLGGSRFGLTEDEDEEEAGSEAGMGLDDLDLEDEEEDDADDLDLSDLDLDYEDEDSNLDLGLGNLEDDDEVSINDLTDEEDIETVINVFKKMSPEDEIEVVQDGDNIDIKDNATGAEYRIELGGTDNTDLDVDFDLEDEDESDEEEEYEEDEFEEMEEGVIYEVVLEDETEEVEEGELEEDSRHTMTNRRRHNLKPANLKNESISPSTKRVISENKELKNKVSNVQSENEQLKEDYNKMVDALKQFRNKLNEVAVFNSNLTYAVRLFTENTTTKDEKVEIIKRFDDVKSLKESKNVYKQLVKEISKKEPIKESIEDKFNTTKTSGSATLINESKVYVNPELEKMKKLWDYNYKK
jgi:hypothetical protein